MIISPFIPLNFIQRNDASGIEGCHVQKWHKDDRIYIEVLLDENDEEIDEVEIVITDKVRGSQTTQQLRDSFVGTNGKLIFWGFVTNQSTGYYTITIGDKTSNVYYVTDVDEELEDTVVLTYSSRDNKNRTDVAFYIGSTNLFFSWRVPGGFKDDNVMFAVENEQFLGQDLDIYETYSHEATIFTLTVGHNDGVPTWYGELLNRILTCTFFYVDGVRYVRNGSSVPERQSLMEGLRLYVFNQQLRQVKHGGDWLGYQNELYIRRANSKYRESNEKPLVVDY